MKQFIGLGLVLLLSSHAFGADLGVKKGLVVHEWGIFRVHENVDMANADLRAEWDNLPDFAYGHIKGRAVPHHWGAVEFRRRPIIFFHAAEPTVVQVKLELRGGMAGVWFPATEVPAVFANNKQPEASNKLQWSLGIKQVPNGWRPKQATLPAVSDRHWINRVRKVQSDEVFAKYSPNPLDVEREKFLYYDGIFPQGKWVKIKVDKQTVSVVSQVKHPVFDVTVVDRRDDKVRVGRIETLAPGEIVKKVAFQEVDASRFASEAADTLQKQLVSAGLFEDEAASLVDLSKHEFFETPGVNLFFRLPQEEYDARLPLTLEPKPEKVVRAGLVTYSHLEPDFVDRIVELVKQLDAPRFAVRDTAMKKLLAIGPAALMPTQKFLEQKDLSFEAREKIEALVKKWSSKEAFER